MAQRKAAKVATFTAALGRGQATAHVKPSLATSTGTGDGFTTRPDKVPTTATQIRMDAALYDAFRAKCFARRQSMSFVVEELVRDWVSSDT